MKKLVSKFNSFGKKRTGPGSKPGTRSGSSKSGFNKPYGERSERKSTEDKPFRDKSEARSGKRPTGFGGGRSKSASKRAYDSKPHSRKFSDDRESSRRGEIEQGDNIRRERDYPAKEEFSRREGNSGKDTYQRNDDYSKIKSPERKSEHFTEKRRGVKTQSNRPPKFTTRDDEFSHEIQYDEEIAGNYIYGRNAVAEALTAEPDKIEKIYFQFGTQGDQLKRIEYLARKAKVPVSIQDKQKFRDLESSVLPAEASSQGVIALTSSAEYLTIQELIEKAFEESEAPIIVILDEIEDPRNFGAIARSAECAGAAGIIVTERNSAPVTPAAVKTSAGALNYLPVARVSSLIKALEKLKDENFMIVGTVVGADKNYYDISYAAPIALVIGSEDKGIRPSTAKYCDEKVSIPMAGKIESLNASVSAGIMLFEIARQRLIED